MPNKWRRPWSLGEILNQSLDETYRLLKAGAYGWSGSAMVQLKVDSDGQIYVANPAGEQYADGTAVDVSYKGNLVLGTDGSNYQILAVDASGNLQVDVLTLPSLPAGTNNIGKVDINAVTPDLMLGTDFSNVFGTASLISATPAVKVEEQGTVNVADGGGSLTIDGSVSITGSLPAGTNIIGAVKRDIVNYTKVWKYVALSTTGETTVWDPTAGKKFVITDIMVSATAAGTCTLRDGTAGSTIWIASLAANGGFVSNFQTPIQSATADNILTAQASAITQYVLVSGYEV